MHFSSKIKAAYMLALLVYGTSLSLPLIILNQASAGLEGTRTDREAPFWPNFFFLPLLTDELTSELEIIVFKSNGKNLVELKC